MAFGRYILLTIPVFITTFMTVPDKQGTKGRKFNVSVELLELVKHVQDKHIIAQKYLQHEGCCMYIVICLLNCAGMNVSTEGNN